MLKTAKTGSDAVYIIDLDGLSVRAREKNIKNLYLRVAAGSVSVSLPFSFPRARLLAFLRERLPWIRAKLAESPPPEKRRWISGAQIPHLGRRLTLNVVETREKPGAELVGDVLAVRSRGAGSEEKIAARVLAWQKRELEELAREYVRIWREKLKLPPISINIRRARSRWGSCAPAKARITLNAALSEYPPPCVEYVVVHELTHMFEPNHGPGFYRRLERSLPDWRERKAALDGRGE